MQTNEKTNKNSGWKSLLDKFNFKTVSSLPNFYLQLIQFCSLSLSPLPHTLGCSPKFLYVDMSSLQLIIYNFSEPQFPHLCDEIWLLAVGDPLLACISRVKLVWEWNFYRFYKISGNLCHLKLNIYCTFLICLWVKRGQRFYLSVSLPLLIWIQDHMIAQNKKQKHFNKAQVKRGFINKRNLL